MTERLLIDRVRLVLADRVIDDASLLIEDGRIAALCPVGVEAPVLEGSGAWLLPGLIDLHGDAIEKEMQPRPGVLLPLEVGLRQADLACAAAGITTPFHSISVSGAEFGMRNDDTAEACIRAVAAWRGLVDGRVHVRYEVTAAASAAVVERAIAAGCGLLSFMDHSPGQGQFRTLAAFSDYMRGAHGLDDASLEELLRHKMNGRADAHERIVRLAALANAAGVPLASHDDDDAERIAAFAGLGVAVSEFPIHLEAAQAAAAAGLRVLLGAPNIVRGGSQGGNMRAMDAFAAGCGHCLCSDYHPPSLLAAVFRLAEAPGWDLPRAAATASAVPAEAVGLRDRGVIAVGQRADLVLARWHPVVGSNGRPVARAASVLCGGRLVIDTADRLDGELACV